MMKKMFFATLASATHAKVAKNIFFIMFFFVFWLIKH